MLTPEELTAIANRSDVLRLWRQLEEDILADMARRIGKTDFGTITDTAAWQAYRLEQSRLFRSEIVRRLAKATGQSQKAVRLMLQQAGTYTLLNDDYAYRKAGKSPPPLNDSPALLNLLNAGARQTNGSLNNLTGTTASTATRQFENALDRAWMQVSSGAFDYRTAIRRCIGTLAQQGLQAVLYTRTGHIDTLEVAVRRAVLTGVNQTCAQLQIERMNQMDCDFVEVTAHAGARPEHADWQGQVFHRGGGILYHGKYYPDFESATGYGTGEGLCGWNCRHNFHPFFPGISEPLYTPERLAALNERDMEWNGQKLTRYELEQKQRSAERTLRAYKRRSLMEAAAGEIDPKTAVKIKEWQAKVKELERVTGHPAADRVMVHGYGRSQAGKVTWAKKRADEKASEQQYRKTRNTGAFSELSERMSLQNVRRLAKSLELDLRGTKLKIVRDESLIENAPFMGYTFPDGSVIQLYPKAFTNKEQLVKTLGHEYIHLQQTRKDGIVTTTEELAVREKEAYASEAGWWEMYVKKTGYRP